MAPGAAVASAGVRQLQGRKTGYHCVMDAELKDYLDALEARLNGKIEKIETTLLTEFHKWASPAEMRLRSHSATLRALDIEMESLADRVGKLEKGPSE
jgi:hypothetical protein